MLCKYCIRAKILKLIKLGKEILNFHFYKRKQLKIKENSLIFIRIAKLLDTKICRLIFYKFSLEFTVDCWKKNGGGAGLTVIKHKWRRVTFKIKKFTNKVIKMLRLAQIKNIGDKYFN